MAGYSTTMSSWQLSASARLHHNRMTVEKPHDHPHRDRHASITIMQILSGANLRLMRRSRVVYRGGVGAESLSREAPNTKPRPGYAGVRVAVIAHRGQLDQSVAGCAIGELRARIGADLRGS